MKCYQCSTPAMYQVGEQSIPLCLNCYFKFSQIQQQELENHERHANYLLDQISASVGMPPIGPRFPVRPRPVHIGGVKLNNISVNNSVVGAINTGSIGSVDQSISALVQLGEPKASEAVKALSEAILQSGDLTQNQKNELIEILSLVAQEAATPVETRRNSVAIPLIEKATKITGLANDISDIGQKWWPIIHALFTSATGG